MELDLGELRFRPLAERDAPLLVEATHAESGRSLWGSHPVGPYTLDDARAALRDWDGRQQTSFGLLRCSWLVGAVGLMPDGPDSAELAYWVRPEERRRGIALRGVQSLTEWAHGYFARIWLEINPDNAPSLRLAERAEYRLAGRRDGYLIWVHERTSDVSVPRGVGQARPVRDMDRS